jgi:hypothetical protein
MTLCAGARDRLQLDRAEASRRAGVRDSAPIYMAASKSTPGIDLAQWRAAYAAMEQDGTRARILATYGLE